MQLPAYTDANGARANDSEHEMRNNGLLMAATSLRVCMYIHTLKLQLFPFFIQMAGVLAAIYVYGQTASERLYLGSTFFGLMRTSQKAT